MRGGALAVVGGRIAVTTTASRAAGRSLEAATRKLRRRIRAHSARGHRAPPAGESRNEIRASGTTLGVEVEAYQALLEGHRAHPEEDPIFDDL